MSISRRALYEAGLPFGESCTRREGGRVIYGGGGGGTGTQTQTVDLPDWVKPYAKEILGKAQALTDQPYQPYTGGERIAGFDPLQQQAQAAAGAMKIAPQIGQATGIAGQAGQQALGAAGQYRAASAGDISSLRGAGSMLGQQLQPGISYGMLAGERLEGKIDPALQESLRAGRAYQQMATDPSAMQAYMSPYLQNVVDIEKREAQRQADIARTGRGAQAVRAGAFGGSRQAIMENEAERNLQQQLGDIQARGLQSAFERAQQAQQFGSELGLRGLGQGLQAQQAASQLGLSGVGQSMDAQRAAADLGLRGTQAALSGTQFGSELGIRGAQAATQAAQTLGGLGATQFGQEKDIIGLQSAAGKERQALEQARLDQQYQDFVSQQQYPYQQLGFFSDIVRGVPVGQTTQTIFQQPQPSVLGQLAGIGTGVYGLSKMFAEGGPVAKYADQGSVTSATNIADIVDSLNDEQLQAAYQSAVARQDVKTAQIIQEEAADRAMTREGRGLAAAADIPEDMFSARAAKGGILKFAEGSDPYGMRPEDYRLMEERARQAEAEAAALNAGQAPSASPAPSAAPAPSALSRADVAQRILKAFNAPLAEPSKDDPYLAAAQDIQKRELEAAASARKAQEELFGIDRKESAERIAELKKSGLGAAIAALGFSAARAASEPGATLLGSFSKGTKDMEAAMFANRKSLKEAQDADKALAREERKLRIAMDEGDAKRAAEHQREIMRLRKDKQDRDDNVRRTNAIVRQSEVQGLAAAGQLLQQEPAPGELLQVADRLKKADPSLSDTDAMKQAAEIIQQKSPSYLTPGQLKPADISRLTNDYEARRQKLLDNYPLAKIPNPTTPAAKQQAEQYRADLARLQQQFRAAGLPDIYMGSGGGTSSVIRCDARGNPIQ